MSWLSGRPWRFRAANPKILWPILSRLPTAVKFGVLGVGGGVSLKRLIVDVDESAATSRTTAAAAAVATSKSAAMRLGLVAFAAEKPLKSAEDSNRFNNEVIISGRALERLVASGDSQSLTDGVDVSGGENNDGNSNNSSSSQGKGEKRVYKYFKNENGENQAKSEKKEVNDGDDEASEADLNGSNNNNGIDDTLSLDEKFLVAAPWETGEEGAENCDKCTVGDALDRQPFVSNGMLGSEVDGLDQSMEVLALDNASFNAGEEDDDDDEPHEDDFDQSKDSPFNKNVEVLVDDALRWNDKLLSEPTGRCQPYDQIPEESFNKWVNDADRMFRERKFEDLKEKFVEEYKKTKGRYAKRDPQLCWRMARITFLMGNEVENNTVAFWKEAMIYAIEAIKNFEDLARVDRVDDVKQINHNCCWKCHLWFGIIMAKLGGLLQKDQKKRLKVAFMAKAHLERAIQINPLDPIPHFALAKWHYEFCKLNAGQMKIVRELGYDTPPTDVSTALRYAERANELTPKLIGSRVGKFPRNVYLMAELYYTLGQKEKAKYLVHALVYQLGPFVVSIEDRRAVERGKVLWMKLTNPVPNNPNDSTPRAGKARPQIPIYPDHHNNLFPPKKC